MKFQKKFLASIFATILIASSIFSTNVFANDLEIVPQSDTVLESFTSDELDQHPDIQALIEEKGMTDYIKNDDQSDEEILKLNGIEEETTNIIYSEDMNGEPIVLDEARINELVSKYNLEKPTPQIKEYEQHILVEKSAQPQLQANVETNVWMLNYITTSASFTVTAVNVGNNPLDSINGTITKYNLSKKTFSPAGSSGFGRQQVKAGVVYTFASPQTAVSDYFVYDITVVEGSKTYKYTNKSDAKPKYQRFLFTAGPYNSIAALGGERHHFVAANSLTKAGFLSTNFPAIRMMYDDHYLTPNWGSRAESVVFRDKEVALMKAKKFKELLQFELDEFAKIKDPDGYFANLQRKYYQEVLVVLDLSEKYFGIN
ncbi:hypothetical protein [Paenibacillus sp. OK003]|uniref:hypothetical protein n=1 Tax=Paenibacillus sp. OK003 TaxID=1884380 RepID=UPI0008B9B8BB|nr:hypothetical protein [Paenibacillus sp. OK003]SEL81213.1 hypothetical protein SAMN05518856_11924 [Paenibacillus sp. OK003]